MIVKATIRKNGKLIGEVIYRWNNREDPEPKGVFVIPKDQGANYRLDVVFYKK